MQKFYPNNVWQAFRPLKKQFRRCVTNRGADRYSEIEKHAKYATYNRFLNECNDFFGWYYQNEPTQETSQEVFDYFLNSKK